MPAGINLLKGYLKNPRYWFKNILWRFPRTVSRREIIFLVGAPRSGTTLLQRILQGHSNFFSIEGETALFSAIDIFAENRMHLGLPAARQACLFQECRDTVDFFDKAIGLMSENRDEGIFIEKTPQHAKKLIFLMNHFPNSRFIHIVRDGRDCFCSAKSHPNIPQNHSAKIFAKYWKKCLKQSIKMFNSNKLYTLRYEDLCDDPELEIKSLMCFLGHDFESLQLSQESTGDDHRANLPEFSRLGEPVSAQSCGRWKAEMTDIEKALFVKIAGRELSAYHYD